MRPFVNDDSESESAWTDKNVSEHPKFYTSDVQSDLTNIGSFFDKNNQYHDKTSSCLFCFRSVLQIKIRL